MKKQTETMEISSFIKILVGVIVLFGLAYLFTEKVVKTKEKETEDETTKVTYNEILVGNSLNRSESEYYVLFYDSDSDVANYFNSWQDSYLSSTPKIKLYYVDLLKTVNKKYMSDEVSNTKIKDVSDFKLKNGTLIKIESGKVVKYIETYSEIRQTLS